MVMFFAEPVSSCDTSFVTSCETTTTTTAVVSSRRTGMPRPAHSKSRLGCKRCKQRKVKCDEVRPSCKACVRHNVPCEYPKIFVKLRDQYSPMEPATLQEPAPLRPAWPKTAVAADDLHAQRRSDAFAASKLITVSPTATAQQHHRQQRSPVQWLTPVSSTSAPGHHPFLARSPSPEPERNRRFEMRLMHHFTVETSRTLPCHDETFWGLTIVETGVQHSFLLDEILAMSALHMSRKYPEEANYIQASYKYFQQSLDRHQDALRDIRLETFEALVLTSIMIAVHAFALMGERLEEAFPLKTMSSWYHLTHSSYSVRRHCLDWVRQSKKLRPIIAKEDRDLEDPTLTGPASASPFTAILRHVDDEHLLPEDIETYDQVLGYIGAMHNLVSSGRATSLTVFTRMLKLPSYCPAHFEVLVQQYRPRAMVLMAHAFAVSLMIPCDSWWAQGLQAQIRYVHDYVPLDWKPLMAWPLETMRNHISIAKVQA